MSWKNCDLCARHLEGGVDFLGEGFTANLLGQSSVTKHEEHLRGWEDQMRR